MKKALLFFGLLVLGGSARAATQLYIPSTATYNNYTINIGSGSIRNLQVQTSTFGWVRASSASIDNLAILNMSSGSATLANLTSTGAVIGTMTVTRELVGISTITNGAINNAQLGSVFSTGTWNLQGASISGTAIDSSTQTHSGLHTFSSYVNISSQTSANVYYTSATITGSVVFNSSSSIKGTVLADNAATGFIGEYVSSTTSNGAMGSTGQYFDVASMTLSAGDWDITAICYFTRNGATYTSEGLECGIGTTTGNSSAGLVLGDTDTNSDAVSTLTTFTSYTLTVPTVRKSLSGSTSVFLKGFAGSYSGGSPLQRGRMSARRIR